MCVCVHVNTSNKQYLNTRLIESTKNKVHVNSIVLGVSPNVGSEYKAITQQNPATKFNRSVTRMEANEELTSIIAQLHEEVKCPICLENFKEPKLLECLHSFCKKCLTEHCSHCSSPQCPQCRHPITVPAKGIAGLKENFVINKTLHVLALLEKMRNPEAICQNCEEETSTVYCPQCNQILCSRCEKNIHSKWVDFRDHKTTAIAEVKQDAASLVTSKVQVLTCKEHGKELKIYCETCSLLICTMCKLLDHKNHDGFAIEKYPPKIREELLSHVVLLNEGLSSLEEGLVSFDAAVKRITDQDKEIELAIDRKTDEIVHALKKRRKSLVAELKHTTKQKLDRLTEQTNEAETFQQEIQHIIKYTDSSFQPGNEASMLLVKDELLAKTKRLTAKLSSMSFLPDEDANMQLAVDDMHMQTVCSKFGAITMEQVFPQECFLSEIGPKILSTEETASTILHAVTEQGKAHVGSIKDIVAELCERRSKEVVRCSTRRQESSKYKITCPPTKRGSYKLHVRINGECIKGSPLIVRVLPSRPVHVISREVKAPWGVAANSKGHLIVAEYITNQLRVFTDGYTKSFCIAGLKHPAAVTVDHRDNIYAVDNSCVHKFTFKGEEIASVGRHGNRPLEFHTPTDLSFNRKNRMIYVCDQGNARIQVLNLNLTFYTSFQLPKSPSSEPVVPAAIAFDTIGHIYITDLANHCVHVFTEQREYIRQFGSVGSTPGLLCKPISIAIDGTLVYVTERDNNRVSVFTTEGVFLHTLGRCGEEVGEFMKPTGIAITQNDDIVIADNGNNRIQIF